MCNTGNEPTAGARCRCRCRAVPRLPLCALALFVIHGYTTRTTHTLSILSAQQVMSLSSEDTGLGAASDRLAGQAPRLPAGGAGYAAWKANMDVFLQKTGANGVHKNVLFTEARWISMEGRAQAWADQELEAALDLVVSSGAGSASTPAESVQAGAGSAASSSSHAPTRAVP